MKRECGTCTKCCDGWLSAEIYGHKMEPGKPCPFVGNNKCSIYEARPSLCRNWKCGWLEDDGTLFDEWMRPSNVNFILVRFNVNGVEWYKLAEAGEEINTLMLSYLITLFRKHNKNLKYVINGVPFFIGTEEFKEVAKLYDDR